MVKMRRRQVKRVIRKFIFFIGSIMLLSLFTTMLVERRLRTMENSNAATIATDFNGDPVTPEVVPRARIKTHRPPKPPVQQRRHIPPQSVGKARREAVRNEEKKRKVVKGIFKVPAAVGEKKDWEDHELMEREAKRVGLGEHGAPAYIKEEHLKRLEKSMSLDNGFNALLSDLISVNRSVPDARNEACRHIRYLARLPSTSVVIPFYNEHISVLQRTLHSIVNRTPRELLQEIVIVDDGSDREELKTPLDEYVVEHFFTLVRIIRLPERSGLIRARMEGARAASGDVLIFFDSHIECNYNWLPPLLEPIAVNSKISTCPIVDIIDHTNFGYSGVHQEGSRGAFDWRFDYKQLPLLPGQNVNKTEPSSNPVMMGGLFAIGRDFYWEVGGYDEGLDIWGAEQFELSFKIWLCGGMLFDVPCSRVAHIFRGPMGERPSPRKHDFFAKNCKRVAEVWLDDYKQYLYQRRPEISEVSDAGDLTAQHAVRERLHCKPFKWFLEEVAPDLLEMFPLVDPPSYAAGALQSRAYPHFCLDTMGGGSESPVGLYYCADNKTHPHNNQYWKLSYARDLRHQNDVLCLDVQSVQENAKVWMWNCHQQGGNQFWYYDREHQWLVHGRNGHACLEAIIDGDVHAVYANLCDNSNARMKWIFGMVNDTALDQFYEDLEEECCRHIRYLARLPSTSVVIPFYNEHISVLQRTLHSIVNRTPRELLQEIVIVDDGSDREELKTPLDEYVVEHFFTLVRIIRLPERSGLIRARMEGARAASGDVLIFFDSHIECNYNWLPPLLEPIAVNSKISTCPIVDIIDHTNFGYSGVHQEGSRGAFDWRFDYKQLPLLPGQNVNKTEPSSNPVMMGGLFAIGRDFYWEVGGYDEGLDIWGAEQFELSFKIWLCGGMLFDVPCSRVAHIFRGPMGERPSPRKHDFFAKNCKRVAEVWLDDYKQYLYQRRPEISEVSDAGDLTAQHAVRERLHCKPFKWFLEEVAPDLLEMFPLVDPPSYAAGALQSRAYPHFCLDTMGGGSESPVGLYYCADNKTHPHNNQYWKLSYARDLRHQNDVLCLDVQSVQENAKVWMWNCHQQGGNQFWYYDREHQWLVHGRNGHACLEAIIDGDVHAVYANLCDNSNARMKWIFGMVNDTALDQFYEDLEEEW